jgi:hypothetical protein
MFQIGGLKLGLIYQKILKKIKNKYAEHAYAKSNG